MRYYIRLDDACHTMDWTKWGQVLAILDKYKITPLIGVIPDNKDSQQCVNPYRDDFWDVVRTWNAEKGYSIAMHGLNHVYHKISINDSINRTNIFSEFAGLPLEEQRDKIRKSWDIFVREGLQPKFFFAPGHTFDINTLLALESETTIRTISDTQALYPYIKYDFAFIPQQLGRFIKLPIKGYWTYCLHPTTMTQQNLIEFENFVSRNHKKLYNYSSINLEHVTSISNYDLLLKRAFLLYKAIKRGNLDFLKQK